MKVPEMEKGLMRGWDGGILRKNKTKNLSVMKTVEIWVIQTG